MCMACVTKIILRTCALTRMSAENLAFCSVLRELPSVHFTGVQRLFSRWFLMAAASPSPPDASTGKPVWRCNRAASSIDAFEPVNTTMACAAFACDVEKGGADRSNSAANNKLPDLLVKNMTQAINTNASDKQIFKRPVPVVRSLETSIQCTFDKTIILPICCKRLEHKLSSSRRTSPQGVWSESGREAFIAFISDNPLAGGVHSQCRPSAQRALEARRNGLKRYCAPANVTHVPSTA